MKPNYVIPTVTPVDPWDEKFEMFAPVPGVMKTGRPAFSTLGTQTTTPRSVDVTFVIFVCHSITDGVEFNFFFIDRMVLSVLLSSP